MYGGPGGQQVKNHANSKGSRRQCSKEWGRRGGLTQPKQDQELVTEHKKGTVGTRSRNTHAQPLNQQRSCNRYSYL